MKDLHALESYFFDRVRKGVVAHGKTVVGWEEVARTAIPDDVLVQPWRSSSAIARVTAHGNKVIATCGYYLDKMWPGEDHYRIGRQRLRGSIERYKSRKMYVRVCRLWFNPIHHMSGLNI